MGIADPYASYEEYRDIVGEDDPGTQLAIDRHLILSSRFLEQKAGCYWNQETVTRLFKGDGTNRLVVKGGVSLCPGIATVTGLVVKIDSNGDGSFSESAISADDLVLEPTDAPYGPMPKPYTSIRLPGFSGAAATYWPSSESNPNIQIAATWGYPSVPAAIKDLCIEFCRIWRVDGPRATGRLAESGAAVYTTSIDAQRAVDRVLFPFTPGLVIR